MKNICENYLQVIKNIKVTAKASDRNPQDITLVVVSKNQSLEDVLCLYNVGCRHFGENRLQEASIKIHDGPDDIKWHFIGSLQKNKVRKTLDHFLLIHGVDSLELAEKISTSSLKLDCVTSILLQVNISGEPTKHGFSENILLENFDKLLKLPNLKIEGLMTMAPVTDDEKIIRRCFSGLRLLLKKLNHDLPKNHQLKTLSMGMSHDYKLAIEEGATLLRIGSAIFSVD